MLDARKMPAREEMLEEESGFKASDWGGLTSLGYTEATRVRWSLPAWYPFGFLPLGDMVEPDLLVFQRNSVSPAQSTASVAH